MSGTVTVSPSTPRHHKQLQPLATSHGLVNDPETRSSSSTLTNTSALPSPSVLAARAYFQERLPPIRPDANALQRRRTLIEGQEFPRRHSVMPSPGGLAAELASFKVSYPDRSLGAGRNTAESESKLNFEVAVDVSLEEVKQNGLAKVTAVATAGQTDEALAPATRALQQVPFQYTHDRLRDWGYAYLGNATTADAFINAVGLRRPSVALVNGTDDPPESAGMVMIRARVNPRAKDRKPFMLQRKFDIDELRASIPAVQRPSTTPLRRSPRARPLSGLQVRSTSSARRKSPESRGADLALLGKGAVPIHIEYALHYLPVLAALMLSGHVRKGDTIDLPVPHPEAWHDVVTYIYTGKGEISVGLKKNILYLAGNAS